MYVVNSFADLGQPAAPRSLSPTILLKLNTGNKFLAL
jgi:hypothetical protein